MNHSNNVESSEGSIRDFVRVLPTALAIVPVGMLFGVLADRANWSLLEIFSVSLLGFSGSGQFALLPLSQNEAGFFTMLLIAASINSRYIPISYAASSRLNVSNRRKVFLSHIIGDEAYATEKEGDSARQILIIRLTIFVTWVVSSLLGAAVSKTIPTSWISSEINLAFPASVVLLHLSIAQIKAKLSANSISTKLIIFCTISSLLLISTLGKIYFWIPSLIISSIILYKGKR